MTALRIFGLTFLLMILQQVIAHQKKKKGSQNVKWVMEASLHGKDGVRSDLAILCVSPLCRGYPALAYSSWSFTNS